MVIFVVEVTALFVNSWRVLPTWKNSLETTPFYGYTRFYFLPKALLNGKLIQVHLFVSEPWKVDLEPCGAWLPIAPPPRREALSWW